MFIDGIGISGFRSFGKTLQLIGPFKNINIFIGQNNSGKSAILRFLTRHYEPLRKRVRGQSSDWKIEAVDAHVPDSSSFPDVAFGVKIDGLELEQGTRVIGRNAIGQDIGKILRSKALSKGSDVAWFVYERRNDGGFALSKDLVRSLMAESPIPVWEWRQVWETLTHQNGGGLEQHWVPEILKLLADRPKAVEVSFVSAIREARTGHEPTPGVITGAGVIDQLAQFQNPKYDDQGKREQFQKITQFVRSVTGNEAARLEVPYERNTIQVQMGDKILPIESLGTGIHEVIIIAAACTINHDQVMCLEEPEIHLHPLLQKKLMRYLVESTSNQYFIATHSAHILDTKDAAVFHVRQEGGESIVEPVFTDAHKSAICGDLGFRASDLLQANCVIWVEGPSDRVYLNHWIHSVAPGLVEGLHYSIMFYGGRLLSHLSAKDAEVDDFISLRKLNRNLAVLIDSDRERDSDQLNETKQRVVSEFNTGPGFAWVTAGREIENYVPRELLSAAVKKTHGEKAGLKSQGQYDKLLEKAKEDGGKGDKVAIAHAAVEKEANLDLLDLKEQLGKLVDFIKRANDLNRL